MLKKSSIVLLSIVLGLAFLTVVLIVSDIGSSQNPEIEAFLEGRPASLIPFRSILGEFEAEAGIGNEIILTAEVDDYEVLSERAESFGTSMSVFIDDVLEDGTSFFVERANELRDEIELDGLRLTIIYVGGGNEITRGSFDSEQ